MSQFPVPDDSGGCYYNLVSHKPAATEHESTYYNLTEDPGYLDPIQLAKSRDSGYMEALPASRVPQQYDKRSIGSTSGYLTMMSPSAVPPKVPARKKQPSDGMTASIRRSTRDDDGYSHIPETGPKDDGYSTIDPERGKQMKVDGYTEVPSLAPLKDDAGYIVMCTKPETVAAFDDEQEAVYDDGYSKAEDHVSQYDVTLARTPAATRCHLTQAVYRLDIQPHALVLRHQTTGNPVLEWQYGLIRNYDCDPHSFTIEAGSRCQSGEGVFIFRALHEGETIFHEVSKCHVARQPWFHSTLARDQAESLLQQDGDYLVRESRNKKTGDKGYVLSIRWGLGCQHITIKNNDEGRWRLEGDSFNTIPALILHQHKSNRPVLKRSEAILKKCIAKK